MDVDARLRLDLLLKMFFFHAVLDTAAGVWLDRNGQVTSARGSKGQIDQDPSFELMRRCRHGAASVGIRIYVHGGLRGGNPVFFCFCFLITQDA